MKKPSCILIVPLFVTTLLSAQGLRFHGKLQNSIYGYESEQKTTRFYQYAQFSVVNSGNRVELAGSLRALSDADLTLADNQRFRAYRLSLAFKNLWKQRLDLVVGRQFFNPGTVLGGLDGLSANVRINRHWLMQLYGGVESSYLRDFSVGDRSVLGGLVTLRDAAQSEVQAFFLQKGEDGAAIWQLAGVNLENRSIAKTKLRSQLHWDLQGSAVHRFLLNARTRWSAKWSSMLEYKMQTPRIYANSYYTIFEQNSYQQLRAGLSYDLLAGFGLEGQYRRLMMEDGSAQQLLLALHNHQGSLGLIYENGDAGDQTGLMFDYSLEPFTGFMASVYVDYSRYRTERVYEYDQQLANAVRCSYRLGQHWQVDVEYQWLRNKFKDNDSRILNHFSFRW